MLIGKNLIGVIKNDSNRNSKIFREIPSIFNQNTAVNPVKSQEFLLENQIEFSDYGTNRETKKVPLVVKMKYRDFRSHNNSSDEESLETVNRFTQYAAMYSSNSRSNPRPTYAAITPR